MHTKGLSGQEKITYCHPHLLRRTEKTPEMLSGFAYYLSLFEKSKCNQDKEPLAGNAQDPLHPRISCCLLPCLDSDEVTTRGKLLAG